MVSILIPYKNTALFLNQCLDSILSQEYDDWEVLAVNDHSTDSSEAIAKAYASGDSRIRTLKNKGEGIISALRTAFEASNGQFITRMDSDDVMAAGKLSTMVQSLQKHGPGHLATGLVKYFSDYGISDGYARYEEWLNTLTKKGINFSEIYKECAIPSPCWMVSRKDLMNCGAFEPDRYPEDYDLTFRFYRENLKVLPCDKILHYWRDYPTRTSRTSEHYALNYFLDIKVHYFLELDRDRNRPLVIWGAGGKGKAIARDLINREENFIWLCDNPNKIGRKIYGVLLEPYQRLPDLPNPQSIVTVANEEAQDEIRAFFNRWKMAPGADYFFFC